MTPPADEGIGVPPMQPIPSRRRAGVLRTPEAGADPFHIRVRFSGTPRRPTPGASRRNALLGFLFVLILAAVSCLSICRYGI
jgi:hypothetical protein